MDKGGGKFVVSAVASLWIVSKELAIRSRARTERLKESRHFFSNNLLLVDNINSV